MGHPVPLFSMTTTRRAKDALPDVPERIVGELLQSMFGRCALILTLFIVVISALDTLANAI